MRTRAVKLRRSCELLVPVQGPARSEVQESRRKRRGVRRIWSNACVSLHTGFSMDLLANEIASHLRRCRNPRTAQELLRREPGASFRSD